VRGDRTGAGDYHHTILLVSRTLQAVVVGRRSPAYQMICAAGRLAVRAPSGHSAWVSDTHEPRVKVRFRLTRDADGWPPAESEGLWAEPLGNDQFRIDNTPWFVRNLSADDVVHALTGSDGVLWALDRVRSSGRLTIRVIPRTDGALRGNRQAVLDWFAPYGVSGEGIEQHGLVALDVPAEADHRALKSELQRGEADGRWHFEEGCVSEAWLSDR
jgi:hypothetical protein